MPGPLHSSPKQTPVRTLLEPNVLNVVLGNKAIKPWYPSFYPREQVETDIVDRLYVCRYCFKYTHIIIDYCTHIKMCTAQHEEPLGELIYQTEDYSIHEVDGDNHKLYAQNLSLFAKLFLDTKSVFFDVSSFLYYTLVSQQQEEQGQVIGFFSKEKMSWDSNNVACILVFPPWQRRGLGQVLMGVSYELGRREDRFGGPERPLSGPGQKGYMTYWCGEICRYVLQAPAKQRVSIKAISEETWIMSEDIVTALKEMGINETRKTASGTVVINKSKVTAWAEKHPGMLISPVDASAFVDRENSITDAASDQG